MPYSNRGHHSRAPRHSARSIIHTTPHSETPPITMPPRSVHPALTAHRMSMDRLLTPTTGERPLTRRALHELQQSYGSPRLLASIEPQHIVPSMHRDITQQPAASGIGSYSMFPSPWDLETGLDRRGIGHGGATVRRVGPNAGVHMFTGSPEGRRAAVMAHTYRNRAVSITPMHPTATASNENSDGVDNNDDDRASQADTISNHSTLPDTELEPVFPTHSEASLTPSDATDCSASNPAACHVCTRREARVRFIGCTHGLCVSCMKGTWWGRINRERHWPSSVPCGLCRAEIGRVWVRGEGAGGPCPVCTVLGFMVQWSASVRGRLRWEEIDRVRPVEVQAWLIYKHRELFLQDLFPGLAPASDGDSVRAVRWA